MEAGWLAEAEVAENWSLVNAPLGDPGSGRARYGAAMFFYKRGELSAEVLETYRICCRLDGENPLALLRRHGQGEAWLQRFSADS